MNPLSQQSYPKLDVWQNTAPISSVPSQSRIHICAGSQPVVRHVVRQGAPHSLGEWVIGTDSLDPPFRGHATATIHQSGHP